VDERLNKLFNRILNKYSATPDNNSDVEEYRNRPLAVTVKTEQVELTMPNKTCEACRASNDGQCDKATGLCTVPF